MSSDDINQKLQNEVNTFMSNLDKDKLRLLQKNVYLKMVSKIKNL